MRKGQKHIEESKRIIPIILGIFLISLASAIYAGDCLEVNLSELKSLDNVVYDVVGNSSNMEGLTIELNETNSIVNICTQTNYKPDNFTLVFIDNYTKETITTIYVGSGGGSSSNIKYKTQYIYENITKYVDNLIDEPKDECRTTTKFNIVPWIFLGLMILYMFITVLSSIKRTKKIKNTQEDEKEEDTIKNDKSR